MSFGRHYRHAESPRAQQSFHPLKCHTYDLLAREQSVKLALADTKLTPGATKVPTDDMRPA